MVRNNVCKVVIIDKITNATNKYKSNYIDDMNCDDFGDNLENVDLSEQTRMDVESKYCWPDEMLGPYAVDEIMIYEPNEDEK